VGKVVRMDVHQRAREDAALWLSLIDRGLGKDERLQLEAWLGADPRHGSVFIELARTWDRLEQLNALSGLVELQAQRPPRVGAIRAVARATWATAVIGLVAFAALLMGRPDDANPNVARVAPAALIALASEADAAQWPSFVSTRTGELRTVVLPDGTAIAMNTKSTLRTQLSGRERQVELVTGEATFNVAHDPTRPFIVRAAGRDIRAIGTVFTVRALSPSRVSVLVTEGRVALSRRPLRATANADPADTRLLEAGDRLLASDRRLQVERLSDEAIEEALAWQNGVIVFQGEPLREALAEIWRYSDARFQLGEEALGSMRVAGVYRVEDLDGFIHSLRVNLGVGARRLQDGALSLYRLEAEAAEPRNGPGPEQDSAAP
jgi:transmembrane sensor